MTVEGCSRCIQITVALGIGIATVQYGVACSDVATPPLEAPSRCLYLSALGPTHTSHLSLPSTLSAQTVRQSFGFGGAAACSSSASVCHPRERRVLAPAAGSHARARSQRKTLASSAEREHLVRQRVEHGLHLRVDGEAPDQLAAHRVLAAAPAGVARRAASVRLGRRGRVDTDT